METKTPAENRLNRFNDRVSDYIKFRPDYPLVAVEWIKKMCNLPANSIIADIGSGTGIFTRHLVNGAHTFYGIEPNNQMRVAAEELLSGFQNFTSMEGNSESTGLPDASIDLICAAQAFHWFKQEIAKVEFNRILKKPGYLALLWNDRKTDSSQFLKEYEELIIRNATDYKQVNHKQFSLEVVQAFCGDNVVIHHKFHNEQILDFKSLMGRLFSSSYIPNKPAAKVEQIKTELKQLFDQYHQNGKVVIEHNTVVYVCQLK